MRRLALLVAVLLIGSTVTVPVASADEQGEEICFQSHQNCHDPFGWVWDPVEKLMGDLVDIAQRYVGEVTDISCQGSAYNSLPTC